METKPVEQIPITDERLKTALHLVRTAFAEWMLQEFFPPRTDCLRILAEQGLCSQQEANDATVDAQRRLAIKRAVEPEVVMTFEGSAEAAGRYLAAELENNLQQAFLVQGPGPRFDRLELGTFESYAWERGVADRLGEMHTCWSPQFQRQCVVAYFDEGDADKIIKHCRHMGAIAKEGADEAFVVVLRPDVGPELYSEEAIREGAEQFNREKAKRADLARSVMAD